MINLPSFREFNVNEEFVSFFESKLESYKESNFTIERNSSATLNGIQTKNLLFLDEEDVNEKLTTLREWLEQECGIGFEYHWAHMIEYEENGRQEEHSHDHNEDYSIIVYLNSCDDGSTYFKLNPKRNIGIEIFPKRCLSVMFSSTIPHGGHFTNGGKKILVLGIKLK